MSYKREAKKGFGGSKPAAASGGSSEVKAGNHKERLRDYVSFPGAEGDYCDSANVSFVKLKLN